MCPSHFSRVRLTSPSSQSRVRVIEKFFESQSESWLGRVESLRVIGLQARVNVESHEISHFFYNIFLLWNGAQYVRKWWPTCYEMVLDKLENCAESCFNKFDCRLFISKFVEIALYISLSLSVISKSLAQPWCKCCSLSVSIVLNVRFITNGMCMKNNTQVARSSRNKMITTWDLYCCLVHQWEALGTCCSAFPITTKWFFDQDVKMVLCATFTKRTCNRCGSLQKRGDVVGTFQLALHWKCCFHMLNTWK